jgi:hypothetical protein
MFPRSGSREAGPSINDLYVTIYCKAPLALLIPTRTKANERVPEALGNSDEQRAPGDVRQGRGHHAKRRQADSRPGTGPACLRGIKSDGTLVSRFFMFHR